MKATDEVREKERDDTVLCTVATTVLRTAACSQEDDETNKTRRVTSYYVILNYGILYNYFTVLHRSTSKNNYCTVLVLRSTTRSTSTKTIKIKHEDEKINIIHMNLA